MYTITELYIMISDSLSWVFLKNHFQHIAHWQNSESNTVKFKENCFIQTLHLLQLINFKSWIENSDLFIFFFFQMSIS